MMFVNGSIAAASTTDESDDSSDAPEIFCLEDAELCSDGITYLAEVIK